MIGTITAFVLTGAVAALIGYGRGRREVLDSIEAAAASGGIVRRGRLAWINGEQVWVSRKFRVTEIVGPDRIRTEER